MDRPSDELNDVELENKRDEFDHWMRLPITQEFRRRVLAAFDHQDALLGASLGDSVDLYKGRAEVLDFILKPFRLFEE